MMRLLVLLEKGRDSNGLFLLYLSLKLLES